MVKDREDDNVIMEKQKPTISEVITILAQLGITGVDESSIEAFIDKDPEEPYEYAVWLVDCGAYKCVLKQAKAYEMEAYRCYFCGNQNYVPRLLNTCKYNDCDYFLTEYFPGEDLMHCDRKGLVLAIDALAEMQNEFWERSDLYSACITMEKAIGEVKERGEYLGSEKLEKVYRKFEEVFRNMPRTLSHVDLLPINVLANDEMAVFIDWEHCGILPYMMPFARLIAHGREDSDAYFYLADEDREFAIEYYYETVPKQQGISWGEFSNALDYFLFYEYCEWIMLGNRYENRDDNRYGYYIKLAEDMADKLNDAEGN